MDNPIEYKVGDRVDRIENREVTAATIISIEQVGQDIILEIQYDEGGSGWWPATAVKPLGSFDQSR